MDLLLLLATSYSYSYSTTTADTSGISLISSLIGLRTLSSRSSCRVENLHQGRRRGMEVPYSDL